MENMFYKNITKYKLFQ